MKRNTGVEPGFDTQDIHVVAINAPDKTGEFTKCFQNSSLPYSFVKYCSITKNFRHPEGHDKDIHFCTKYESFFGVWPLVSQG